ncbi:MAG: carboxymuconolactone decarboxylase family protein [Pseudomonadota bacterium]
MTRVAPIERDRLPALQAVLEASEQAMGFVPNSMLTMAHMPQLTMAFSMFAGVVFGANLKDMMALYAEQVPADEHIADNLPPQHIQLIAYAVSVSAGCRYCQAHTSHNGHRFGLDEEQLHNVMTYETAACYSAAERALIGVALAAGEVPNGADDAHFSALAEHFTERQIVQIVGVIGLFGFLNRWNDTMATQLEDTPIQFAQAHLAQGGWQIGKHG